MQTVSICPVALDADIPDIMIMRVAMITKLSLIHDFIYPWDFSFTVLSFAEEILER